jgi:hypothetical protein
MAINRHHRYMAATVLEGLDRGDLADRDIDGTPRDVAGMAVVLARAALAAARDAYGPDLGPWLEGIRTGTPAPTPPPPAPPARSRPARPTSPRAPSPAASARPATAPATQESNQDPAADSQPSPPPGAARHQTPAPAGSATASTHAPETTGPRPPRRR